MMKINITKPTGTVETLSLISAFKSENNTYVILDSEKIGSMGLPIIYVAKYTNKLEKINDQNEWQSVKNCLKGIISGTNFEYVKMNLDVNADEVYYTPLTLPQASFNAIKSRYVVDNNLNDNNTFSSVTPVMPDTNVSSNNSVNVSLNDSSKDDSVMNLIDKAYSENSVNPPLNNATNVAAINAAPVNMEAVPPVSVVNETPVLEKDNSQLKVGASSDVSLKEISFENDKETFLKACENMFDALVSKYQKELNDLKAKEQELLNKESEINIKLRDANEHLANAEARETVANIAHDNAQRVMDLNNFMPVNPNSENQN